MNVVLVVFDSLRKDCIGAYGKPFWGEVRTPNLDALAKESLVMTRAYPETLPTLPTRRALYTGRRVYPFHNADFRLKGDFVGAAGWGPIPEDQSTLSEILREKGYRTGLIADVYHMFKPSKNYWRGFDQWTFLRGQERDPQRSGPRPSKEEIAHWLPKEIWNDRREAAIAHYLMNMRGRDHEEDYFGPRVLIEAARWLQENRDAGKLFLVVESFDPHEPWFVPEYYRRMYDDSDGPEQVLSVYAPGQLTPELVRRTQANYSGLVTMCDRWFGHLYETMRSIGLLENTLLIVTTDHGHSIGDRGYTGKRGYPSDPSVYDVPIFVRHPEGLGAGKRSDLFIRHTDISAAILEAAGVKLPGEEGGVPFDGKPFLKAALDGGPELRTHVTVGWSSTVTVIDKRWWLNCKVDGKGVFLHDLTSERPFEKNLGDENPDVVNELFRKAVEDAGGEFPEFVKEMAAKGTDAPGCSDLAARA